MEPVATFPLTSTTDLRALFNANTLRARQALRKVVVGKLLLEPVTVSGRSCYKISGQPAFRRLLPADLAQSQNRGPVVAPTGFDDGTVQSTVPLD
jgi:hypothetical protein